MLKLFISILDRKVHHHTLGRHFIALLQGRRGPACSIRSAPNPHKPMPDQRLAEALLKHAGMLHEHEYVCGLKRYFSY